MEPAGLIAGAPKQPDDPGYQPYQVARAKRIGEENRERAAQAHFDESCAGTSVFGVSVGVCDPVELLAKGTPLESAKDFAIGNPTEDVLDAVLLFTPCKAARKFCRGFEDSVAGRFAAKGG
jgi:hypothetical protein